MDIALTPDDIDWIVSSPDRTMSLRRRADAQSDAADVVFEGPLIEAAFARDPDVLPPSIEAIVDGWKVTQIRPFRPLVYYAAFGDDDIFGCLALSLRSLLEIGAYRDDIAVITSPHDAAKVEEIRASLALGDRLKIVLVDNHADIVDFYLARFEMRDPVFDRRQPVLYLDVDVVVDAAIEPFLMTIAGSNKIHVMPEGPLNEGHPESDGHWYGWRMMAADGMDFDPHALGFSSGIIASGQGAIARHYAGLVLDCAEGFQKKSGSRRPFLGYDQCVANYVFLKTGIRSFDVIENVVTLLRLVEGRPPRLPEMAQGFVHFLNVPTSEKRQAMAYYMEQLAPGPA